MRQVRSIMNEGIMPTADARGERRPWSVDLLLGDDAFIRRICRYLETLLGQEHLLLSKFLNRAARSSLFVADDRAEGEDQIDAIINSITVD